MNTYELYKLILESKNKKNWLATRNAYETKTWAKNFNFEKDLREWFADRAKRKYGIDPNNQRASEYKVSLDPKKNELYNGEKKRLEEIINKEKSLASQNPRNLRKYLISFFGKDDIGLGVREMNYEKAKEDNAAAYYQNGCIYFNLKNGLSNQIKQKQVQQPQVQQPQANNKPSNDDDVFSLGGDTADDDVFSLGGDVNSAVSTGIFDIRNDTDTTNKIKDRQLLKINNKQTIIHEYEHAIDAAQNFVITGKHEVTGSLGNSEGTAEGKSYDRMDRHEANKLISRMQNKRYGWKMGEHPISDEDKNEAIKYIKSITDFNFDTAKDILGILHILSSNFTKLESMKNNINNNKLLEVFLKELDLTPNTYKNCLKSAIGNLGKDDVKALKENLILAVKKSGASNTFENYHNQAMMRSKRLSRNSNVKKLSDDYNEKQQDKEQDENYNKQFFSDGEKKELKLVSKDLVLTTNSDKIDISKQINGLEDEDMAVVYRMNKIVLKLENCPNLTTLNCSSNGLANKINLLSINNCPNLKEVKIEPEIVTATQNTSKELIKFFEAKNINVNIHSSVKTSYFGY